MDFFEDLFDFDGIKKKKRKDGYHNNYDHDYEDHHEDHDHDHNYNYSQNPVLSGSFCPRCSTQVVQNAKFCQNCGLTLNTAQNCSKCGNKITVNAAFCPECGNKLR